MKAQKQTHICKKCKKEFEEYRINRDCSCNDGLTEEGECCMRCSGSGCDDSIEKTHCKQCRYQYEDEYY